MAISKHNGRIILTMKKETIEKLRLRFPTQKLGIKENTLSGYIEKLVEKDFKEDKEWEKY